MLSGDLIIAFMLMSLIFLRQISIIKESNKIDYAPVMLSVGSIGAMLHFMLHPQTNNSNSVIYESLLFMSVSIFLYLVMNILHQNQKTQTQKADKELTKVLLKQIEELREINSELEKKVVLTKNSSDLAQHEATDRFKYDIKAFESIESNQEKFLDGFKNVEKWHSEIMTIFTDFTKNQLPSLDSVVHNHIDILRVAEQDHFNKVKSILAKAVESRCDMTQELNELKNDMLEMKNNSKNIANEIIKQTTKELHNVATSFEKQLLFLKSHTEDINTSLYEDENRLKNIKENSEIIMRQMVLSSNKMGELEDKTIKLNSVYMSMKSLLNDIEVLKSEYIKAQAQLSLIIRDFKNSKDDDIDNIKEQMESLIVILTAKIDNSLEKLHSHYNIANEDISQSVKILAKKSQLKSSYTDSEA